MKIDAKDKIADLPILKVRDLVKRAISVGINTNKVINSFKVDHLRAQGLLEALVKKGYITNNDNSIWYSVSEAGMRFANASGARAISRKNAQGHINKLLQRISDINASDDYLFKVTKAICFGSYADSSIPNVNDIDVYIKLERKGDDASYAENKERVLNMYIQQGRNFSSYDQYAWPQTDVYKYLKNRSRVIAISTEEELIKESKSTLLLLD